MRTTPDDETILIFVKQMNKPIMLHVRLADTVAETMKKFMDLQGIKPEDNYKFRWVFAGKMLELDKTLKDSQLNKESVIVQHEMGRGHEISDVLDSIENKKTTPTPRR